MVSDATSQLWFPMFQNIEDEKKSLQEIAAADQMLDPLTQDPSRYRSRYVFYTWDPRVTSEHGQKNYYVTEDFTVTNNFQDAVDETYDGEVYHATYAPGNIEIEWTKGCSGIGRITHVAAGSERWYVGLITAPHPLEE